MRRSPLGTAQLSFPDPGAAPVSAAQFPIEAVKSNWAVLALLVAPGVAGGSGDAAA